MAKPATVIGIGQNNNVLVRMQEALLQAMGDLPLTAPLVVGQQVELEPAETATVGSDELVTSIDTMIASANTFIGQLQTVRATLVPIP